jgi:uncharacterized protein YjiS (DUF1127 family)
MGSKLREWRAPGWTLLVSLVRQICLRVRQRRTQAILDELSDVQLKDIGLPPKQPTLRREPLSTWFGW